MWLYNNAYTTMQIISLYKMYISSVHVLFSTLLDFNLFSFYGRKVALQL